VPLQPPGPPIPRDPLAWRPQWAAPSRSGRAVRNAILEPLWEGDHVLVHAGGSGVVRIIAGDGEDLARRDPELAGLIGEAIGASEAVVDGFLTRQATRPGNTVTLVPTVRKSPLGILSGRPVEIVVAPADEGEDAEGVVAFVAVDLLRVEGQDLFDVPLLERKRILDSLVVAGDRVRVSPYTQPPVQPWLHTWQAAGFRGLTMKAANSRYVPGAETREWAVALARSR
jgi:bifunctional non-homologous end joining protein LigD